MLLLYCVTEAAAGPTPPPTGVHRAAVESLELSGLRCFYSAVETIPAGAESLKRDALDFHRVTRELFQQAAIIPFRFPTTLAAAEQLDAYLRGRAGQYREALAFFRDKVQVEIRIGRAAGGMTFGTNRSSAGVARAESPLHQDASSGTGYLKTRARRARQVEQAIAACRAAIAREVIDWRQRDSSRGVRCFVLIRREAVGRFQQQIKQARLPEATTAAMSGPWPPTEFFPVLA